MSVGGELRSLEESPSADRAGGESDDAHANGSDAEHLVTASWSHSLEHKALRLPTLPSTRE